MSINEIIVNKSKVHNLKSVSVTIPKNSLTVITGPSGSGKSSLAFDTIYVEGQRRYIESLSSYARQFLGQYQPPDVESISGLSPAIAIDQKSTTKNPRSTVGTITEIFDYLRVLYARVGDLHDPESNEIIKKFTPPQIVRELTKLPEKTKVQLLAPIQVTDGTIASKEIIKFLGMGYSRARINGELVSLDESLKFKKNQKPILEIVIDRILIKDGIEKRLTESVEHTLKLGSGHINLLINDKRDISYSEHMVSAASGKTFPDLEPRLFSFNSPIGACPKCNGLGQSREFNQESMIFDDSLPVLKGAIEPLTKKNNFLYKMVECMMLEEGQDPDKPLKKISKKVHNILWYGTDKVYRYSFKSENSHFEFSKAFPGILNWFDKKFHETGSEKVRKNLENFMKIQECQSCKGYRLNEAALSTFIKDRNIMSLCLISIEECYEFFSKPFLKGEKAQIGDKLIKEIKNRLKFLVDVGLGYLSLNRSAASLSGGESQRIRLATQIGSALSGVLYVLDEPSIGLHQRDNTKLIKTLKSLRDLGNTVIVVEHDEETMLESDYIIDLGPGAGRHGGEVVKTGKTANFLKDGKSLTARYLNRTESIPIPELRRKPSSFIELKGATHNNLNKVDIKIPMNCLVCITGVSGSGKSTLLHEVLVPACKNQVTPMGGLYNRKNYHSISNLSSIKSIIELDQSPIGRTPHSNPATYTNLFDNIRKIYSQTPESQIRGYKQGRFSFNVKGGRCEECEGNGVKKIEMHFLPDVYIICSECKGRRYNNETLSVLYKGQSIADVLDMTIDDAFLFFKNHPKLNRILYTLISVGLGYMKLGQPATTLSGGEAQRLKLSRELAKRTKGKTLYILDEPTTGLHFADVKVLLKAINNLVTQGHSVLIIEHNLDIIKSADYLIDLGPDGGSKGGTIVATGTPEEVSKVKESFTGKYLKKCLKK
jgi:excinuclease ABC subunit A